MKLFLVKDITQNDYTLQISINLVPGHQIFSSENGVNLVSNFEKILGKIEPFFQKNSNFYRFSFIENHGILLK